MSGRPDSDGLKDVVEMLLDKGVVINADIVVTIGQTELLGIQLRAALASFETAAKYGLQFPEGTDMERVEAAAGRSRIGESSESDDPDLSEQLSISPPAKGIAESSADESEDDADEGDADADDANDVNDADGEPTAAEAETEADSDADDRADREVTEDAEQ